MAVPKCPEFRTATAPMPIQKTLPVATLTAVGIRASLFIDADPKQLDAAVEVGAPVVEIHTGHYAEAANAAARQAGLARIAEAVDRGNALGLLFGGGVEFLRQQQDQHIVTIEGGHIEGGRFLKRLDIYS